MIKHAMKHIVHTAVMALLTVAVVACGESTPAVGGLGKSVQASALPAQATSVAAYKNVANQISQPKDDDVRMSASRSVMSGTMDEFQASAAEMRHFAVYTNYIAQAGAARNAIDAQEAALVKDEWVTLGKDPDCAGARIGM